MFIQSRKGRSIAEYQAVIDCILAGNVEEAEHLTHVHLRNIRHELIDLLVKFVLPYVEEGL